MNSNMKLTIFFAFIIFTTTSALVITKNADYKGYKVIHVNNPITDTNQLLTTCLGDSSQVKCYIESVKKASITQASGEKHCSFNYAIDSNWTSESLKLWLDDTPNGIIYADHPFVVALQNYQAVVGWIEVTDENTIQKTVIPKYRLKLKNIRFEDCKISDVTINLGYQLGNAFVNIEPAKENEYNVVVVNYAAACNGKMCSISIDVDGQVIGNFHEWHNATNIVTDHVLHNLKTPKSLESMYPAEFHVMQKVRMNDSVARDALWLAHFKGSDGKKPN